MARPTKIQHPLLRRTGVSQRRRGEAFSGAIDFASVDGRSLADILEYFRQYARQVVFPKPCIDETGEPFVALEGWESFFEKSLPFVLAQFSKKDFVRLEEDLSGILAAIEENAEPDRLRLLVDFCFYELIQPIQRLRGIVIEYDFDFGPELDRAVGASMSPPLVQYVLLCNACSKYLGLKSRSFAAFSEEPWSVSAQLLKKDYFEEKMPPAKGIAHVPGGREGAVLWLKEMFEEPAFQMLRALRGIANRLPDFLESALKCVGGRHEPHLGLLFAFLRLFRLFQNDLNALPARHLEFFYRQVLRIEPKKFAPDKAHVVFEIARHLPSHPIPKETLLKDGKDSRNIDVLFGLDEPVVIDQAQVKELKTLFLNTLKGSLAEPPPQNASTLEGVYVAPAANSADGQGKEFKEDQSRNWATLGARWSKFVAPGKEKPEAHPYGRLGFVLASPVLWLQEGQRRITIQIECDATGNKDIFGDCFKANQDAQKIFYQISEATVRKIEGLFSIRSRAFLQQLLDTQGSITPAAILTGKAAVLDREKQLLELLFAAADGEGALREMPFASLVRHFNLLRLQRDPYPVGFDAKSFLEAEDPITCKPLLTCELTELIKHLLDQEAQKSDWITVQLSGHKGWFSPKSRPRAEQGIPIPSSSALISWEQMGETLRLKFVIDLQPDEPEVTFYDADAGKEAFDLEVGFPMAKIELNPEIRLVCDNHLAGRDCCLGVLKPPGCVETALYHFFRNLVVKSVQIDVRVCGMKKLVVQNEESLQDVNAPILPFGSRPRVGSECYIGNKELFGKNWTRFWLFTRWKNKPENIEDHYKDYDYLDYQTKLPVPIGNDSFRFMSAVLEEGTWVPRAGEMKKLPVLFSNEGEASSCERATMADPDYYKGFNRQEFVPVHYEAKSLRPGPLGPLSVETRDHFFRMSLAGTDFQHNQYAFVLASKLMVMAGGVGPTAIEKVREDIQRALGLNTDLQNQIAAAKAQLTPIKLKLSQIQGLVGDAETVLDGDIAVLLGATVRDALTQAISDIIAALSALIANPPANPGSALTQIKGKVTSLGTGLGNAFTKLEGASTDLKGFLDEIGNLLGDLIDPQNNPAPLVGAISDALDKMEQFLTTELAAALKDIDDRLGGKEGGVPKEPYTPTIKSLEMDYEATATVEDIELIHLYPFANSSKTERLPAANAPLMDWPALLPTFVDEGTLFVGLEKIRPGGSLQLLFQFAEATADSESEQAQVEWRYLTGNRWQPLRPGFEIVSDATEGLTRSGIVKLALPRDISNTGNTLMPKGADGQPLYWLKVSATNRVAAVAELIGVHAQAALVTYAPLPGSDVGRVAKPLEPKKLSRPLEPDFSIKKVEQLYPSFHGRTAEAERELGLRVSERLRHKGRGIDPFDLEHLVLENFPELFKCKCISHTMALSANEYRRDLEVAPGFVTVAVVPDLTKLIAGNILAPRAPASLLTRVRVFLKERMSAFARVRVMNPRYERIRVELKVRLVRGRDEAHHAARLKKELTEFLAPWHLGDSDKLAFGQHVLYSDVIGFVEGRDYVDFVSNLKLFDSTGSERKEIVPLTARSILTGGEVCIEIDRPLCVDETAASAPPQPPLPSLMFATPAFVRAFSGSSEASIELLDPSS
jgi:hypothetical protein